MNALGISQDWMMVIAVAVSAVVMYLLVRRMMRGMNQQDWILLRQARARGIDLTQPQPVGFVLFTDSLEVANELAEKLRRDAYETSVKEAEIQYARSRSKPGQSQSGWLITAIQVIQLVPEELTAKRKALNELADAPRAAYLGWQIGSPQHAVAPPAA